MAWNGLICKKNYSSVILMLKCHILTTGICWTSFCDLFAPNVPLFEESRQLICIINMRKKQ